MRGWKECTEEDVSKADAHSKEKRVSIDRINEIFTVPVRKDESAENVSEDKVVMENVSFRYSGARLLLISYNEENATYTLYGTFSYNFLELGRYIPELINCIARAQIVFNYMEENEENISGDSEFNAGKIELKNVSFGYDEKEVIHNLSAEFEENKSTAIIGHTGCGKSTLIKLLMRLYPVSDKKISIGGNDINLINIKSLRDNIAYVPQEPYLFQDTIRENIRYGNMKSTDEDVENAAKLASAHDFILRLPKGYDTVLRDGGKNLSGGERQRIALARAFTKNAALLLMDEATSALDNTNETQIQASIKKLINGKTALIVAHRDITIDFCDEKYQVK